MAESRSSIPAEYKWDLSELFESTEAFEEAFRRTACQIKEFASFRETMCLSGSNLLKTLTAYNGIHRSLSVLFEYAERNSDVDLSDNAFQSIAARVRLLYNDFQSASFFFGPQLVKIPERTLRNWYLNDPELKSYRRFIDGFRRYRKHTLPDRQEKILADLSNALHSHETIRSIFADADLQFPSVKDENGKLVPLTDASYIPFMMSPDRNVRIGAFQALYQVYEQFGNTFAGLLNGFVRETTTLARIRKFENSLEASVFDDEVPSGIYRNLVQTVRSNLEPLFRYYDLKKKLLDVSELHLYDIYTPLISSKNREYTYEEAVDIVLDALKIYGTEYSETLKAGLKENRWVDVFPSKGKRGGAYSAGCYDSKPYMLLNFNGTFDDVSTLAHEAGHSMHSWYSRKNNPPHDSSYTIFVAEVASTVNELLLAHHLLKTTKDRDVKLDILDNLMSTYKGTLYRQTMFAEFEEDIHKTVESGEPLTKELLSDKYYQLNLHYFGENVVCDPQIAFEWMRIPHFYYNFYVYKYATCISAASAIAKRIETEGEPYIRKYLAFLSCGNSKSPIDSLKTAEIDMTRPDVILSAIDDFRDAVAQFEELLGQ